MIFCEERLKPKEEREASPTRQAWQAMKASEREHDRAEYQRVRSTFDYFSRNNGDKGDVGEWRVLKQQQRNERITFFTEGKQAYRQVRNSVFREVRENFREEWRDLYVATRAGGNPERLAIIKSDIIAAQSRELEEGRAEACTALREQRDQTYKELLGRQKDQRAELRQRQNVGLRSPQLLHALYRPEQQQPSSLTPDGAVKDERIDATGSFRKTVKEVCDPAPGRKSLEPGIGPTPAGERARVRDGLDAAGGIGLGVLGAITTIGERLFDGFFGGGEAPMAGPDTARKTRPDDDEREKAMSSSAGQGRAETEAEEARRLQAIWEERRHRKRERD